MHVFVIPLIFLIFPNLFERDRDQSIGNRSIGILKILLVVTRDHKTSKKQIQMKHRIPKVLYDGFNKRIWFQFIYRFYQGSTIVLSQSIPTRSVLNVEI